MDNTIATKKTQKKQNRTLLQAIENVAELSRDSKLREGYSCILKKLCLNSNFMSLGLLRHGVLV